MKEKKKDDLQLVRYKLVLIGNRIKQTKINTGREYTKYEYGQLDVIKDMLKFIDNIR